MSLRALVLVLITTLMAPVAAAAQVVEGTPVLEVGADVSAGPHGDGEWSSFGGRVRLNFDRRTAVEGLYSPERVRGEFSQADYFTVHVRRSLHMFDGGALFGGLGVSFASRTYREVRYFDPGPSFTFTSNSIGPSFALGAEVEVAPYLAVRGETQYVLSDASILRFSGGVSVPIGGRYPGRAVTVDAPSIARTPLARVRSGQMVWVTMGDGREYQGEVAARSPAALTLRHAGGATTIATSDIQRIEAPDTLLNGVTIGMGAGGAAGGVLGGIIGDLVCEQAGGCVAIGALLVGGMGAGMGGLVGVIVDSFRETRQPVYERGPASSGAQLIVAPVISRDRAEVSGAIRW
jgi:hypothetical protein